ncbi:MAG: CDP-alcohol phosphatidyltransferase family protein, partial [Polyangiaceae bacterium]
MTGYEPPSTATKPARENADGSGSVRERRAPWSLVRSLTPADVITMINAICGVSSVLATLKYMSSSDRSYLWLAIVLLPIAGVADFMGGRVARKTRRSSMLGGDLDSLSDLISFGLAPACLGFALGLNGGWDSAVLVYFVCCGLGRLARYNATASTMSDDSGKVRYYQGAPIPTSLVLVAVLAGLLAAGLVGEHLPFGELAL